MKSFDSYFTDEHIIKLLCRFRLKYAKQRHKIHLLRDISLHDSTLKSFRDRYHSPPELSSILPPRRKWIRLKPSQRAAFTSSTDIALEEIRKTILTTQIRIASGEMDAPLWYSNLLIFIENVKNRISGIDKNPIQKPKIIPIRKENKITCRKFRPISQYELIDRIIIGQTARYLTLMFDDQLMDCSFAFRAKKKGVGVKTHHDAIQEIQAFRLRHVGQEIYVAECDIKKFFDCVEHGHIKGVFLSFVKNAKLKYETYDDRATDIFFQYLGSYAFNVDVYSLKGTSYFERPGFENGEFEWPERLLTSEFYNNLNDKRIGVPQGGALSCLIANLILHDVDRRVLIGGESKDLLFLRFCDDMILLATTRDLCEQALSRYVDGIKANYLLIHEPKELIKYSNQFYNSDISKSKKPFLWASTKGSENASPWISFVGYQIRYDSAIRVRKKSLQKEVKKQEKETGEVLRAIRSREKEKLDLHSRKSLKQQIIALESRLIAMSVGRHKLYNYKVKEPALCWTNGFKILSFNHVSKSQLKYLDSRRNRQLFILKRELSNLKKASEKPDLLQKPNKFNGTPFSYFGFLARKMNDAKRK